MSETLAEAQDMADRALHAWGGVGPARLVTRRENTVFQVDLPQGRAALRLHRRGYQSASGIAAELQFMTHLTRAGVPVPQPIARPDGSWLYEEGGRHISCVCWLEGVPLGRADMPLDQPIPAQAAQMRALGALAARMHAASDGLVLNRPQWNAEGLLGAEPLWGRFWEHPGFSVPERAQILAARAAATARLATGGDYGPIHADLLRENILIRPEGLALIDFDDGGMGYRHYDLGTALVQGLEEPGLTARAEALLAGYTAARGGAQPAPTLQDLTFFVMLRCFASVGWIATRAAQDDPRQMRYTRRAVRLAGHFLDGSAVGGL
jgi:Ser/Thr protein kinase RdoA (MazF antagonist)